MCRLGSIIGCNRALSKVKTAVCTYIVMKEWIENGEFHQVNKIVVVGTKRQAVMVKYLFRKSEKNIYYCEKPDQICECKNITKWIVFENKAKRNLLRKDYHVLIVPDI